MRFRAVAMSCIMLAAACQQTDQPSAAADISEKESGIPVDLGELRAQWVAAAARDDATAVAAMYSDDAILMNSDGTTYSGRAAIAAMLAESFKTSTGLTVTEETSETAGDLVYETGQWQQQVATPDGKTMNVEGNYLVISRRQPDGTWKIVRHVSILKPPART